MSICSISDKIKIYLGGAPVFNWHEIRKRKRKGSKTRPHSSPDPSCGRDGSRGGAIPFLQKNSLPRRIQISFQDFRQKKFEHQSKDTAKFTISTFCVRFAPPRFPAVIIFRISLSEMHRQFILKKIQHQLNVYKKDRFENIGFFVIIKKLIKE